MDPEGYERLRYGERLVWHINWLVWEVNNGGFDQFLTNSAGDHTQETIAFLGDIGAKKTQELLQRVAKIFPNGIVPRDREGRCKMLFDWEDREGEEKREQLFSKLDDDFYAREENLAALTVAYIRQHPDDFQ